MPKRVPPLIQLQIRNAKPKEMAYKLADGGGLYLEVTPAGGKHWRMKYRRPDGREAKLNFGAFPDVSLNEARDKRDSARQLVAAVTVGGGCSARDNGRCGGGQGRRRP